MPGCKPWLWNMKFHACNKIKQQHIAHILCMYNHKVKTCILIFDTYILVKKVSNYLY